MAERIFRSTRYRLPDQLLVRDSGKERRFGIDDLKIYAYAESESALYIAGEVLAWKIREEFCMVCTIYDADGDILETTENVSYGSGLVTSMIKPGAFFNGYPFVFYVGGIQLSKIEKIRIIPSDTF